MTNKEKLDKEVSNKEEKTRKQKSLCMIDGFIGKDVSIILRGGNKLEGKLESVTQYELVITISHDPVIVMKHAIDYIGLISKK